MAWDETVKINAMCWKTGFRIAPFIHRFLAAIWGGVSVKLRNVCIDYEKFA
jgi:hypothetical protein